MKTGVRGYLKSQISNRLWLVGVGLWALAATAGCLERKETIKVARDGAVVIEIEYSGKPEQFETADALPSPEAGWPVRREVEAEENGEQVIHLTAARRFEAREDLPDNYAASGDADARLYTQFPTDIRLERRADGVYMHFRRVYLPRPWAYVEFWRDQLIDDDVKKLSEKPVEEMTAEEKIKLVQASAGIEFYKQIELAERALGALSGQDAGTRGDATKAGASRDAGSGEATERSRRAGNGARDGSALTPALSQGARGTPLDPPLARGEGVPQDVWLRARGAMLELAEETDWEGMIARLVSVPEEQRAAAFEAEADRLLDATYERLVGELARAAGWDDAQGRAFEAAYEREEKRYNITSDLGSHSFKIRVEMPGEIVAHNGDSEEDGAVEWKFSGEAFRDRPYELMVTARVK